MPANFNLKINARDREAPASRSPIAVWGSFLLLAGSVLLVSININFGRYGLTWFLWNRADGTVTSPARTSKPTIRFATRDGVSQSFTENYVLLCGASRDFCAIRDFDPGQAVPVVYDPGAPERAFVYDWALFSGVISWFLELGCAFLFALIFAVMIARKPLSISFNIRRSA
jgi:hypothetical protein